MGLRIICQGILILISTALSAQWVSGGSFGTNSSKVSGTTLSLVPTTTIASGALIFIACASDNITTTDGAGDDVTASCDGGVGALTRFGRQNNGNGSAGAGVQVTHWVDVLKQSISGSNTITITFPSAITAKAVTAWYFTKPHGSTYTVSATSGLVNDAADPGSITHSSLANIQHLAIRTCGHESDAGTMSATDGTWSLMTEIGTSGGTDNTNIEIGVEFKIFTGTSITSDPTYSAVDHSSRFMIIDEVVQASFKKGILFNF